VNHFKTIFKFHIAHKPQTIKVQGHSHAMYELRSCITYALLLAVLPTTSGEQDAFQVVNFLDGPDSGNRLDRHLIQSSEPVCLTRGSRYTCGFEVTLSTTVTVQINVNCAQDTALGFDFRAAEGCSCSALVPFGNGGSKPCPCVVCPSGFGPSPISIDCDYRGKPAEFTPWVVDRCSRVDCGYTCAGVCTEGCEDSSSQCQDQYCNPTAPPTARPIARPIAPPTARPIARPIAPPPIARPIAPPIARPIAPPTARPIAPPTARPIAPPTARPIAPPTARPIAPPTARPIVPPPTVPDKKVPPEEDESKAEAAKLFSEFNDIGRGGLGRRHARLRGM
jgi:hypothetical protein